MAKLSMVQKELKRAKLAAKYSAKRAALRDVLKSQDATDEQKHDAMVALTKLPRDGAKTRGRNRCKITGRPHGYYRKFGLCRNKLRETPMRGDVPGLVKASW